MGKKSKIGKQRRDRYYHLARETGYRSRAAFKLIQLNRKFEFLQKARVLVDLCAAPGGWMQVAKENMPVSSVVIGVDMFPMKPLPGCIFLQEDITTDKCRVSLQRELKTWKADVILNDGAPNVGKNWLHDAYNQVCLTLSALKLATQFLREGGYFITKVFRSKDYNALLWVLKQLFKKVHSTKPQASRSESAEIFIVCQHYLAPSKLDNKFLDPNYVFKDLETNKKIPLLTDKVKKPKAEGYPDDPSILHTKLLASAFINSENAIAALQNASEIVLDDHKIRDHPATTNELKSCFEDIKILGRKDLRNILNWWKALRKEKEESKKKEEQEEKKVEVEAKDESDEEKQLDDVDMEIKKLEDEERRESKRKRKKVEKERTKLQMKMTLKMKHENDLGPTEQADREMFQLSKIASKNELHKVSEEKPETLADSDEEVHEKQPSKVKYNTETSYLDSSGMFYRNEDDSEEEGEPEEEEEFESDRESLGLSGDEEEKESKKDQSRNKKRVSFADTVQTNPLLVDLDSRSIRDRRLAKAQLWFDKDIFKDAENESDEDYELDKITTVIKDMGGKLMTNDRDVNGREDEIEEGDSSEDNEEDSESESEIENEINVEERETTNANLNEWDVDEETTSGKKKRKREKRTLDDKGLALGSMMATSKKMKRDILDSGWNRFAFNDENLPDWFVENEAKYMRKQIPVPKELVDEYQKRKEELNVRPIKKVIEAKARKKKRTMRKMEKAKKKLEGLMENPDVTDAEKARQVKTIYKKLKGKKPNVKYVVAKKHTTAKRVARPRGVKGPYKVVDPRMKKEMRAKVKHATKNKSKKASNKIRRSMKPRNHKRK